MIVEVEEKHTQHNRNKQRMILG